MPDYRRHRVTGGCYFFYGESVGAAQQHAADAADFAAAPCGWAGSQGAAVHHRRMGCPARSSARRVDPAGGR
jgi:hypothetical protein